MCKVTDGIVLAFLIICGIWDVKKRELPLYVILLFGAAALVCTLKCKEISVFSAFGGIGIGICFLLVSRWTKEAVGYGDSMLITILGGYLGFTDLLAVMFYASAAAGLCSLFCLWRNKFSRVMTIPFVPFLAAGYLGGILL